MAAMMDDGAGSEPNPQEDQLFSAVRRNDLELATYLITSEGVSINKSNSMCKTPLFLALENENMAMVKMLMVNNADINMTSYCHMYCTYETPVVTAARRQRMDFLELFLSYGCDIEGNHGTRVEGKTALQWAATHGNVDMAEVLLAHGADVNWLGMYFQTALHYATIGEKPGMVQWLLNHGADININGDGRSPLHIASVRGNFEIVQCLLNHKCDYLDVKDNFSFTPFTLACLRGHLKIIKLMTDLCRDKANSMLDCDDGLLRASESGHISVMKFLIAHNADVNVCNQLGERPLSIASRGQYQATLLLLEAGACMDVVDQRGYCPLQLALLRDQVDIATMLILHGASVDVGGGDTDTPLALAFSLSNPLLLRYIMQTSCHLQQDSLLTVRAITEKQQESDYHRQASLRSHWGTDTQQHMWQWILTHLNQPKSLSDHCRIAIRGQLRVGSGSRSILGQTCSLPLPIPLLKYIALEDIIQV